MSTVAFLISDGESLGGRVREVLLHDGQEVPASRVLPLDQAAGRLAHESPDLVIVVLPPDPDRALVAMSVVEAFGKTEARARATRARRWSGVGPQAGPPRPPGRNRRLPGRSRARGRAQGRAGGGGGADAAGQARGRADDRAAGRERRERVEHPGGQRGRGAGQGAQDDRADRPQAARGRPRPPARPEADLHPGRPLHERRRGWTGVLFERTLVRHTSGIHLLAPPRTLADRRAT